MRIDLQDKQLSMKQRGPRTRRVRRKPSLLPSRIEREVNYGRIQWRARFTFNEQMKHLGFFVTKEDAVYAIDYAYEYLIEERKWAGKWRSFADFEPENIAEPIVQVRVQVRKQIRRLLRKAAQC